MTAPLVVCEKDNGLKPAQRKKLEAAGVIVLVVNDITKVKILESGATSHAPATNEDDGFSLDG